MRDDAGDEDEGWDEEDREPRSGSRYDEYQGYDEQRSADIQKADILGEALYGVFPVLNALRSQR